MLSEVMRELEELAEERERIMAREGTHHAGAGDHCRPEYTTTGRRCVMYRLMGSGRHWFESWKARESIR